VHNPSEVRAVSPLAHAVSCEVVAVSCEVHAVFPEVHALSSYIHAVFYSNSCSIWVKFLQYLREVGAGSSEVCAHLRELINGYNAQSWIILPKSPNIHAESWNILPKIYESEGILPNTGTQHCDDRTDGYSCQLEADILMQRSLLKQGRVLTHAAQRTSQISPKTTKHFSRNPEEPNEVKCSQRHTGYRVKHPNIFSETSQDKGKRRNYFLGIEVMQRSFKAEQSTSQISTKTAKHFTENRKMNYRTRDGDHANGTKLNRT
jgi:hypothetical protein